MKNFTIRFFLLLSTSICLAQNIEDVKTKSLTLNDTINLALENNYDIKKQRYALAIAKSQLRQAKGSLDIEAGVVAKYSAKNNPVDENDPGYYPFQVSAITMDNVIQEQSEASVFLKKLFSFGLETRLSYTVQRLKNRKNYSYDGSYTGERIDQEDGRNTGDIALEFSLPLFKSFKNSLTALQLESAQNYIEQMEYALQDTISQSIINVSQSYWNYFLACKNVRQLEILQKKIEERNGNMESLIKAGVRPRNDMLAMQVNVNETRRQLQEAKVHKNKAKTDLMTVLGTKDFSIISEPENFFGEIDLKSVQVPQQSDLNEVFFNTVESNRTDLLSLKKNMEIAESKIRYAKADRLPEASLNFSIGTTGATYSNDTGKIAGAGFKNTHGANLSGALGASIKLGNNTKTGALEQAEAEYNSSLNEYNKARNTVEIQIQNATDKLKIYKNLVDDADNVLVLNKQLYENEQKRFNAGLITIDNLLSQDQKFISAELSYYQVLVNYMQAILEYKYYTASLISIDGNVF